MEFKNESGLEFSPIDAEQSRTYEFPDGAAVTISEPLWLHVSDNGHRILDAQGVSHYVPNRWIHLYWKAKPGRAHFVK